MDFSLAQEMLQSDSLLVHYDSSKKLVLECDASHYGVGAFLSHIMEDGTKRPASRTLSPSEMNYCQLDREGLGIILALNSFTLTYMGVIL